MSYSCPGVGAGTYLAGAAKGLTGILGVGSFIPTTTSNVLKNAQANLSATQKLWTEKMDKVKNCMNERQFQLVDQQMSLLNEHQKDIDQTLSDEIKTNRFLIYALYAIVSMILLFLIV